MTTRWIAASLAVLALAGCHKKDEPKPPPPKPETPTTVTTTTPPSSTPTTATPPTDEAPPVQEGQPTTATSTTTAGEPAPDTPSSPAVVRPRTPVLIRIPGKKAENPPPPTPSEGRPPIRIGSTATSTGVGGRPKIIINKKTVAQASAETNVLGAWVQSDQKTSILRFTPSGWVSLERGNDVINGRWTADSAGAINFALPVPGGEAKLVAHYDNTKATGRYIVVIPNQDGPQIWPRYGQLIFNPQVK